MKMQQQNVEALRERERERERVTLLKDSISKANVFLGWKIKVIYSLE